MTADRKCVYSDKHTPGPWKVNSMTRIEGPSYGLIASVRGCLDDQTTHDNARLIAEAPAMVEALRDAVRWVAKGVADGAYASCVAPHGAEACLRKMEAILARIDGLSEAGEGYTCRACGRPEIECSAAPCPAVISDREA